MFYVFKGDIFLIKSKIKSIAKDKPIYYVDSIEQYYNDLFSSNLFNEAACYIVTDDKFITTNDKVKKDLSEKKFDNIVILILQNTDSRNSLHKQAETFKIDKTQIANFLKKEYQINIETGKKIADLCECDLLYISLEINKILNFNMNIDKLIEEDSIGFEAENLNRRYVSNFMYKKVNDVLLLNTNPIIQQNTLPILTMLYNNIKNVLQVISCNTDKVSEVTGLNEQQITIAKSQMKNFDTISCLKLMKRIYDLQKQMKSGEIEQNKLLDMLLINSYLKG